MLKIKTIMSKPVVTVKRDETIKAAVDKMVKKKVGGVVVVEKKIPIGIFTRRDLMSSLLSKIDIRKSTVEAVMHTPVLSVSENYDFIKAARQMGAHDVRRFIALGRDGEVTGIVTDVDVVKAYTLTTLSHTLSPAAVAIEGIKISHSTPLSKAARMMFDERRSCAVIIKNRKAVGIVNETLFLRLAAQVKDPLNFKAGEKMITDFCAGKVGDPLRASVLTMIKKDFRNVILSDEEGNYAGLVSLRELVLFIIRSQL